jgi:hypothetical protein
MALLITDTTGGLCAAGCSMRLQAHAVFVWVKEGPWHS